MNGIKEHIREVYVKAMRLPMQAQCIGDNDLIRQLGIDSIMALEILIWIESEFGIVIPDEDLSPRLIDSIDVLATYIEKCKNSTSQA